MVSMSEPQCLFNRRNFLNTAATLSAGVSGLALMPDTVLASDDAINILGPRPGYSPQIGTFVSMLTWMQTAVPSAVKSLTQKDLDHLFDSNANRIALLLHLAATETYYQMNTFDGKKWDSWPDAVKQKWDPAMNLGKSGRATISLITWTSSRRRERSRWRNSVTR